MSLALALEYAAAAVSAVVALPGVAYALVYAWSLFRRKTAPPKKVSGRRHRFAVVVAARNEEKVIGHLVDSLMSQAYPRELYDVIVVPNGCTDSTASAAMERGARVIECTVKVSSKGEALAFALDRLAESGERYDAYCFFDADNIVDPGFLGAMDEALSEGCLVAQGMRDSKNPYDTWISGCNSICYWILNRFVNAARARLGLSAFINGTGYMVSAKVFDKVGWRTQTITEDLEFTIKCILAGYKVGWVPKARTYDEQTTCLSQSWKQRKRWAVGSLQCFSLYGSRLARAFVKEKSLSAIDALMYAFFPALQIAGLAPALMASAALAIRCTSAVSAVGALKMAALFTIGSYLLTFAVTLLAAALEKRDTPRLVGAAAAFFIFAASWAVANASIALKKSTEWEPIKHTRALKISEIT